jgi:hypothetical protein
MDFEAIKQALVTMANAMVGVMERLDQQIELDKQILDELKKLNEK